MYTNVVKRTNRAHQVREDLGHPSMRYEKPTDQKATKYARDLCARTVTMVVTVLFAFEAPALGTVQLQNAAGTGAAAAADVTQFLALINTHSKSVVTEVGGDLVIAALGVGEVDNDATALLREAIGSATVVTLRLGRAVPRVFVGAWRPPDPAQPGAPKTASDGTQVLDLDDIKALKNPHSPACGIMHELWEVFVAARDGDTFKANAHARGIGAENTIHDKKGKDARGGAQVPGEQAPGSSEETPSEPRSPEETPSGGWYIFIARNTLGGKVVGWDRLRIEGRTNAECNPDDRILGGFLGDDELGPLSVPVPVDPQTIEPLCDVYLMESVFVPKTDFVPTVSEWGLGVMLLLVLTAGTVVLGRRRYTTA